MKYHPHGGVFSVTFSIEEGLLLLCNPLCELLIRSCLARAQFLYPVRISHIMVEATHVHLTLVVDNPANLPEFIRYFKSESAHLLNRILGRKKRTVWCEGYDSPIVLTPVRALLAIVYLYSNPSKDNLEESVDQYPGFSSWGSFQSGNTVLKCPRIRRNAVKKLPPQAHSLRGYEAEAKRLLESANETFELILEPNAWMEAFGIRDLTEQESFNDKIVRHLRLVEERARQKRLREHKSVIGKARLRRQVFDLFYRPDRKGKKTWCLTEDRTLRKKFIQFLKALMDKARRVSRAWKLGDFSQSYPLGLYPPSMPKLAEPISIW